MNFRELHNVECIEIQINGAGEYFLPRPQFCQNKIDSMFIWDGNPNMYNQNIYLSVYSIEKKPLYINVPGVEFVFDNFNNAINEVIDFDLLKVVYTGSENFTLRLYFSMEERIVSLSEYLNYNFNCKNLHINIADRVLNEIVEGNKFFDLFSSNEAAFLRGKKIRAISCNIGQNFSINFCLKSGKSMNNIAYPFFHQSPTPLVRYANLFPFLMNDEIDLDRSNIILHSYNQNQKYIDLVFFYE